MPMMPTLSHISSFGTGGGSGSTSSLKITHKPSRGSPALNEGAGESNKQGGLDLSYRATFEAAGGDGNYTWEIRSSTEDYFGVTCAPLDNRCAGQISQWSASGVDAADSSNLTFAGVFKKASLYCRGTGELWPITCTETMDGTFGAAARISPIDLRETVTIIVRDGSGNEARNVYNFDLIPQGKDRVKDILAIEMYLGFEDVDDETGIQIRLYDAEGKRVAQTEKFNPWRGVDPWMVTSIFRFEAEVLNECGTDGTQSCGGVKLEDIKRIELYMEDACCRDLDVYISYLYIYSKYWNYFLFPTSRIHWENSDSSSTGTFTDDAIWEPLYESNKMEKFTGDFKQSFDGGDTWQ